MKDLSLLLQVAEQANHGQFVLDHSARVVLWNPWMEAASEVGRAEAQGLQLDEIFGGVVSGRLRTAVTQALEQGHSALLSWAFNVHPLPLCQPKKKEQPLPHSVSITALSDQGEGRYCLVEVRDLTHVVHRERILREQKQELARANRALEESNRCLHDFAHMASHDLKEPLRTITTYSEFLEEDLQSELSETAAYDLRTIVAAARRMDNLINSLLELARTGDQTLDLKPVSIDECVDEALEALSCRIEEAGANLTRDPLPTLRVDRTLITALYQNLIANALKFSGGDAPSIRLTATAAGENFILGVKDHGIGIDPEQQGQIFKPFGRAAGSERVEGTGIGLAICQKVVSLHNGSVWVESEPGHGCHFKFALGEAVTSPEEIALKS